MRTFFGTLFLCVCLPAIALGQKFKELAQTPPMGWNSWNTFQTKIDEKLIKGIADAMVANGMRDAGYVYIVLDDGWSEKQRDADGKLVGDKTRFPGGMKALGDYLHEKGFKFGIYNCAGTRTCADYPGGHDHEMDDAATYASWGVDYLKYDWCKTEGLDAKTSYTKMSEAIKAAGRPMVFSLCEWGQHKPWEWAEDVGHLWRTTGDIGAFYQGQRRWNSGWKDILDKQADLAKFAGPGHWNDPDMLEVGVGQMPFAESRAHFSFWCMLASPLIAGNDVRKMKDEIRDVLTNKDVIAINQDALGKQGFRVSADPAKEVWAKELSDGDYAVCVLNAGKESAKIELNWKDLSFLKGKYSVLSLWDKKDLGTTETNFSSEIASHDVALFRLHPAK